jgi:multiple sugar transport system permease protein
LIDGASYPHIFARIVMPLCKPAVATLAIITVIAQWNSFIEPMIYLNEASKFPISVGLQYFRQTAGGMTEEPKEHLLMCASVLTTLPPIIVFFLFQEYFVQGVVMSGIKG